MAFRKFPGLALSLLILGAVPVSSLQWYVSNIAAQTLVPITSTLAKRAAWALLIEEGKPEKDADITSDIRSAILPGYRLEKRTLWQSGKLYSVMWSVLDDKGVARYFETLQNGKRSSETRSDTGRLLMEHSDDFFGERVEMDYRYGVDRLLSVQYFRIGGAPPVAAPGDKVESASAPIDKSPGDKGSPPSPGTAAPPPPPGPELKDPPHPPGTERSDSPPAPVPAASADAVPGSVGAGASQKVPLWTDTFFYTRRGNLRLVQRVMADGTAPNQSFRLQTVAGVPLRLETWSKGSIAVVSQFDELGREIERNFLSEDGETAKSTERYTYASTTSKAGIVKLNLSEVGKTILVETDTDEHGRIIAERHLDTDGKLLESIENVWTAGRLSAVITTVMAADGKTPAENRRSEYQYDPKGTIILERDYLGTELERLYTRTASPDVDGTSETEELYQHGSLILRARYADGQKISEELFPITERPPDAQ